MIPVGNALSHFMVRFDSPDSLAWPSVWIRYAVLIAERPQSSSFPGRVQSDLGFFSGIS
jgi:hypothetical protein